MASYYGDTTHPGPGPAYAPPAYSYDYPDVNATPETPAPYIHIPRQAGGRHNGYLLRGVPSKLFHVKTQSSIPVERPPPTVPDTAVAEGFTSTAKRFVERETDVPGPGNYTGHGRFTDDEKVSFSKTGYTAGFASRDRRFAPQPNIRNSPGPAAYVYNGTANAPGEPTIGALLLPMRAGLSPQRHRPPVVTPARSARPAAAATLSSVEGQTSSPMRGRSGRGGSARPSTGAAAGPSRQGPVEPSVPGADWVTRPGPGGARSSFASGTARLKDTQIIELSRLPGPGKYNVSGRVGVGSTAYSAFRSSSTRLDERQHLGASALPSVIYGEEDRRREAGPGPGSYGLRDSWRHVGEGPADAAKHSTLPGVLAAPGTFTAVGVTREALATAGAAALRQHMHALLATSPGPGAYNVSGRLGTASSFGAGSSSSFAGGAMRGLRPAANPGPALYRPLAVDKKSFHINPGSKWC